MSRPNIAGRRLWVACATLSLPVMLAGCDSTRDALGLTKKAPDEFAVVTKAPLVLPPEFGLRPPEPGAPRPQEVPARDRAAAALGGRTDTAAGQLTPLSRDPNASAAQRSAGESALLQQARATNADPDIRRKVNDEFTQLAERDRRLVDRLIFWQKAEEPGLAVDPAKEAQRLRENAATGKAPTAGQVPTIKRRERGPLEGIF
ncbi:DUF3035 domain-containing protein [Ferrovibrio sp.]|uniref:DUF3035 domain-containing protein n=1 Tax=Ferrovibrio sp. TaxID=1917215 RepID=UPI0026259021|nr:DUF3035 domain-containing protein [Ferrovibrio sp.]